MDKNKMVDSYEKKKAYNNKFNKETYKQIIVRINKKNDNLIKWIESKENKTAYITQLIENDMKKK